MVYDISTGVWSQDNGTVLTKGIAYNAAAFLDGSLHSICDFSSGYYNSSHLIASLCGVHSFSGSCDDENQCTLNDTCQSNGQCIGSSNLTCPAPSDQCQSLICYPISLRDVPTGTPCTLSNKCMENQTCSNGVCSGTPVVCPPPSNQCQNSSCDPLTGYCMNLANGTPCSLSDKCIQNTSCSNGNCSGIPVVCAQPSNLCQNSI